MKFPQAFQVLLCPASPDIILAGAYTLTPVLQIKIFDVVCTIFQPKIWLFKRIKFAVMIGVWMSSSIYLNCWLMGVTSISSKTHLSFWWFWTQLRLNCHIMRCFARNSWIFSFLKIFSCHFEAPTNVEKLSESIFPGLPLQFFRALISHEVQVYCSC